MLLLVTDAEERIGDVVAAFEFELGFYRESRPLVIPRARP